MIACLFLLALSSVVDELESFLKHMPIATQALVCFVAASRLHGGEVELRDGVEIGNPSRRVTDYATIIRKVFDVSKMSGLVRGSTPAELPRSLQRDVYKPLQCPRSADGTGLAVGHWIWFRFLLNDFAEPISTRFRRRSMLVLVISNK